MTWHHIKTLLTIPDGTIRHKYEEKIVKENLSTRALKELIKRDKEQLDDSPAVKKLPVERGKPWTYRLTKLQGQLMVDLGFRFRVESPVSSINTETVIKSTKTGQAYRFDNTDSGSVPYYTYKAYVLEVIDGDTIWADIDLGFNTWTTQKLRLKGINTADFETPEGKAARDLIRNRLKGCKFIAIRTYWRDKFTRYLADIFYDKKIDKFESLVRGGKFINQEVLYAGLANRY